MTWFVKEARPRSMCVFTSVSYQHCAQGQGRPTLWHIVICENYYIGLPIFTNEPVRKTIIIHIGSYEDLLATVKRRHLKWYGLVTRSDGLTKVILQGTVEGSRRRGRRMDRKHRGVDRQILRWDSSHGTQPEGVERTDEEVRHDPPLRLLAEQGTHIRISSQSYLHSVHGNVHVALSTWNYFLSPVQSVPCKPSCVN